MTEPDEEFLEKLRRGFKLRMDTLGQFTLDGDAITHPGVVSLLRGALDLSDDGEPIVRVGEQWTYVEVADCVLRVVSVDAGADGTPYLHLDDGRQLRLEPDTLWEQRGRGLRCTVPSAGSGRALSTRFTNAAQMDLDRWIVWPDEVRPVLEIAGQRTTVPERD